MYISSPATWLEFMRKRPVLFLIIKESWLLQGPWRGKGRESFAPLPLPPPTHHLPGYSTMVLQSFTCSKRCKLCKRLLVFSFYLRLLIQRLTPKWFQETVRLSTVINCFHSFYRETICFWIKVSLSYWFLAALLKLFFAINVSKSYDF